jgi:hypothetical protein
MFFLYWDDYKYATDASNLVIVSSQILMVVLDEAWCWCLSRMSNTRPYYGCPCRSNYQMVVFRCSGSYCPWYWEGKVEEDLQAQAIGLDAKLCQDGSLGDKRHKPLTLSAGRALAIPLWCNHILRASLVYKYDISWAFSFIFIYSKYHTLRGMHRLTCQVLSVMTI